MTRAHPRGIQMGNPSASSIHRQLRALANRSRAESAGRFFKTAPGEYGAGDRFLGITVPVLRKLAREHGEEIEMFGYHDSGEFPGNEGPAR